MSPSSTMLDVSGSTVIAHYHSEPRRHSIQMLSFQPSTGPYNNYLVDSVFVKDLHRFHYTIQSPILATLLGRYHGLYRERLSASHAPKINVTSDGECEEAERVLCSKPELPAGWEELAQEALTHLVNLDTEARMLRFLELEIEYALVRKLVAEISSANNSWEALAKNIATFRATSAPPPPPAPTAAQRVWSWISASFTKRASPGNPPSTESTPTSASPVEATTVKPLDTQSRGSFASPPPSYPSPPPYSPPRNSATTSCRPPSASCPSRKLISTSSHIPTTKISPVAFNTIKTSKFLPTQGVTVRKGDYCYTFPPYTPYVPPQLPLILRVLDTVLDVIEPFQGVLE
ncbi:hypothetical protein P7C70_g6703, partial [Phenoliferia sp. Uapishka_3]